MLSLLTPSRRISCFFFVALLVGCGGSVADGNRDSSVDSGDGNDGGNDSSVDGSYDGSDGNPGTGGTSTECKAFDDEESAGFFEIEIVNSTSATIYLGQEEVNCTQSPFFTVADDNGDEVVTDSGDCFASCAQLRDGHTFACPDICRYPAARRLEAGESTRVLWDARSLESRTLPETCAADAGQATSCQQWRAHEDEKFTFSVRGYTELNCDETVVVCSDECDEADGGGCDIQGALVGGTLLSAESISPSGPDAVVTLVFEEP